MGIIDVLLVFRSGSREKTSELSGSKVILEKEKDFFFTVFDNAVNSLSSIVNGFNATKNIAENDFIWLMQLYTYQCVRELYDISKKIEDNSKSRAAQNIVDVKLPILIEHLEIIIGGEDIKKYIELNIESIRSFNKEVRSEKESLISKTAIPLMILKENGINLKLVSNDELLRIAKSNYEKSMQKFLALSIQ